MTTLSSNRHPDHIPSSHEPSEGQCLTPAAQSFNMDEFCRFLDTVNAVLGDKNAKTDQIQAAMHTLVTRLNELKRQLSDEQWQAVVAQSRQHPVVHLIHEDPFTGRAFQKPRGYAGDAVMMDMIYALEESWDEPQASDVGRAIFQYTSRAPSAEAVRIRRAYIADLIDDISAKKPGIDILAIAAGHLREAMITTAMRRGRVGSFVALDADKESLAEVGRAYQKYGVKTVPGSFTALTKKKIDIGTFDLVYSTGLFDYLNQDTGRSLTTAMFNLLKPGGEMVIVNFMPAIRDIGYMETFMAWDLIYRDRNQMLDLARDIDEEKIKGLEIFTSDNKNIIYLKIKKVD